MAIPAAPTGLPATRPRWWRLAPALPILGLAAPDAVAPAQEGNASQGAEIAAIWKVSGKLGRDDKDPRSR